MDRDDCLLPDDLRGRRGRKMSSGSSSSHDISSLQNACDIEEISKGKIVSYQAPGTPPIPPTSETGILTEHLGVMNQILERNNELLVKIEKYLTYKSPTDTWYELRFQTTVQTPNQPATPETTANASTGTPGYDFIDVNKGLNGRNAQKLYIVNDGPDNLFVITSNDGKSFSPEFLMINGETRIINDVYEFRVRSPNAGLSSGQYTSIRATEREIYPPYTTQVTNTFPIEGASNKTSFSANRIAALAGGNPLTGVSIPIPNGFAITVRSNIDNAGNSRVYVANSIANTGIVGSRITLSPGDSVALYVTNANLIFVRGLTGLENVDWIVEQ